MCTMTLVHKTNVNFQIDPQVSIRLVLNYKKKTYQDWENDFIFISVMEINFELKWIWNAIFNDNG